MDINLGIAENLSGMLTRMVIMLTTARALTILGLGVLTFKFLDLFLETNIVIAKKQVDRFRIRALMWALLVLLISVAPIVILIMTAIRGKASLETAGFLLATSILGCLIFGFPLKAQLPADDPRKKQWILVLESATIAVEVIGEPGDRPEIRHIENAFPLDPAYRLWW